MRKRTMMVTFVVLGIMTAAVSADVYNYGQEGSPSFGNGDWTVYKEARAEDIDSIQVAAGAYVHVYFNAQIGAWNDRYDHGAVLRWTVPDDKIISSISFDIPFSNNGNDYYQTIVSIPDTSDDANIVDNEIAWSHAGAGGVGSYTVDMSGYETASVEIGFRGKETYSSFHSYFDNVSITTTVPEPATLLILGFGAVGTAMKKRFVA